MELEKSRVVMLPTNKSYIYLKPDHKTLGKYKPNLPLRKKKEGLYPQHLYLICDEEIEPGDWFLWKDEIHQYHSDVGYGMKTLTDMCDDQSLILNYSNYRGKIVATTDPVLQNFHIHYGSGKYHDDEPVMMKSFLDRPIVPQIPQDFIEKYCKKNGIGEVLVEFDEKWQDTVYDQPDIYLGSTIKTDSNNIITTHSIQSSWNREEVIHLLKRITVAANMDDEKDFTFEKADKWIKENL